MSTRLMRSTLSAAAVLLLLGSSGLAVPVFAQPTGHRQECHRNAQHQLVCRQCWHENGHVRCSQSRIVR